MGEEGLAVCRLQSWLLALKPSSINQRQTHPPYMMAFFAYLIFLGNMAPLAKTTVGNIAAIKVNGLETILLLSPDIFF